MEVIQSMVPQGSVVQEVGRIPMHREYWKKGIVDAAWCPWGMVNNARKRAP